jgi:urease accessory protein
VITPFAEREILMNRIAPRLAAASLAQARINVVTIMVVTIVAAAMIAIPTVASAHPGHEGTPGLVHGFLHPLGGLDHILAMVAVGLFAARLGGRALWLVPASFVVTMAVAGIAGMTGFALPYVEAGIALSILVLGAAIALEWTMPVAAAMGLVAFFAVFHGHAHGAEMPQTMSGLAYGAGFIAATAALHALGIGLGLVIGRSGETASRRILQIGGSAAALAGAALLAGTM